MNLEVISMIAGFGSVFILFFLCSWQFGKLMGIDIFAKRSKDE